MDSEKILMLNTAAYSIIFLYYLKKDKYKIGAKNILFLWLAISAFSSYMFYIQPGFEYTIHYSQMTVLPFVYLLPCLVALYYPVRKIKLETISKDMLMLPFGRIRTLMLVCLPFLLFIFFAYFTQAMSTSLSSISDVRMALYGGETKNVWLSSKLAQIIDRLFTNNIQLFYCLSFYCLVFLKKKDFITWLFILLPYGIGLSKSFATATRATIFFMILIMVFQYMVYHPFMHEKMRQTFKKTGIVIGTLLALLLFFMTISRFGDKAGLYFYKYAGEAMINFNGILFNHIHGTTDGMAYFWYIPQLLGFGDASFADLSDKWDFIDSKTGVTGMIFYTAVGAFIIEFGKFKTLLLVGGLSWLMCRIFSQRLSARILIVLCWCAYQLISSVYLLPIQGDGGIISLFGVILFYYVFSPKFKQRTIKNLKL